jgi:DNA-binding NtrC family response regulator
MSPDLRALPILLVDDEPNILKVSQLTLQSKGVRDVMTLNDSRELLPLLARQEFAVIVLDLFMPHLSGLELLPQVHRDYPHIPVIVMTAVDATETAVECMRAGAFDYLVKPVDSGRMISSIKKALEMRALSNELSSLKMRLLDDRLENAEVFSPIVTASKKMRSIFQYMEVVAKSRQPLLIIGETGTGKELFARALHELSGTGREFVAVNVAGLDDAMFSDTLFGHRKGAFTGADQVREGLIARAAGGTLFLDEIGDLNESSQIKLLRLLQELEYYPVGSDTVRKSDARVILATNHDLQKKIGEGKFRNDLYYRLCAHQIHVPPLRERVEDIPLLLEHCMSDAAQLLNRKKPAYPPELVTLLETYSFPGNVRELQAMVFDAVTRHGGGVLSMDRFKAVVGEGRQASPAPLGDTAGINPLFGLFGRFPTIHDVEEYMIAEAMKHAKGNQGIAASLLGITRQTLNKRLKIGG